jgi:Ca-activated chloride channel family protein
LGLLTWFSPAVAQEESDEAKVASAAERQATLEKDVTQGALRVVHKDGTVVECPLRHTDVQADVAGFIARVTVTQTFYNPSSEKIEAVYVFPLPHEAAVDDMTMELGDRRIVGIIKRRAEARRIYEAALAAGQTAALLEQERPNIFTQSVGNIDPGEVVNIKISYVDVLRYDVGTYEFHFPMVVGPRFNPGAPIASPKPNPPELQGKVSPPTPNTTRVPDASRISPPVLKPGHRTGHDVSLAVRLDAGVPIQNLKVTNHEAEVTRDGKSKVEVKLSPVDSIPNKDFVFRYDVVGKKPEMAVLTHTGDYTDTEQLGSGYFMLMVQPKEDERLKKSPPREIVFLVDVSGSMSGQPTAKVIEAMQHMLKLCRPIDTVQVITFAGQAHELFPKPVPVDEDNIQKALKFTSGLRGGGGTHMLKGIKKAIDQPLDKKRLRIVVMLTDGYIGNEAEIIKHVGEHCGDQIRFWAIGMGQSPNMFLIDGVAKQGGGMGKKLGLNDDAEPLCKEIISRIQRAQLAKIQIDFGGLDVHETYPARIPELWAGSPVILFGRYTGGGEATITVNGQIEGEDARWPLDAALPKDQPANDVLAKVWARKKIEDLMHQTYYIGSPAIEEQVTGIALDYRLMSQYTSFVAVDEQDADKQVAPAQPPRRMLVPVPLPEGTRWEGFFGPLGEKEDGALDKADALAGVAFSADALALARPQYGYFKKPQATSTVWHGRRYAKDGRMMGKRDRGLEGRKLRMAFSAPGRGGAGFGGVAAAMPGPMPSMPAPLEAPATDRYEEMGAKWREANGDVAGYVVPALQADGPTLTAAAQKLLAAGQKALEQEELEDAHVQLLHAYFLDEAAANRLWHQAGSVSGQALGLLEEIHDKRVKAWMKKAPELGKQLDLVLRDRSIQEALNDVAEAAGIEIELMPGGVKDAQELTPATPVRVTYLDLRRATVDQALDWILRPARLTWRLKSDGERPAIVAASGRRLAGQSAWVYDLSLIAMPLAEEVKDAKQYEQRIEALKKAMAELRDAIGQVVGAEEQEVVWFSPTQLLVVGGAKRQAKVEQLLSDLAKEDLRRPPHGKLGQIYMLTVQRAKARRELAAKVMAARRRAHVARAMRENGWKLLAAAVDGRLDDEAFTELQIAWDSPEAAELRDARVPLSALRSAWVLSQAARLLPDSKPLARLAAEANRQADLAVESALASLKDAPSAQANLLAAVYAALVAHQAKVNEQVLDLASESHACRALLIDRSKIDPNRLTAALTAGTIRGDDLVVLTALACRRAGDDTWSKLRAERRNLLGEQALSGEVIVLVNGLEGPLGERLCR